MALPIDPRLPAALADVRVVLLSPVHEEAILFRETSPPDN